MTKDKICRMTRSNNNNNNNNNLLAASFFIHLTACRNQSTRSGTTPTTERRKRVSISRGRRERYCPLSRNPEKEEKRKRLRGRKKYVRSNENGRRAAYEDCVCLFELGTRTNKKMSPNWREEGRRRMTCESMFVCGCTAIQI